MSNIDKASAEFDGNIAAGIVQLCASLEDEPEEIGPVAVACLTHAIACIIQHETDHVVQDITRRMAGNLANAVAIARLERRLECDTARRSAERRTA